MSFHYPTLVLRFYAKVDELILDKRSPPAGQQIEAIEPEAYYSDVRGYDGQGLRVPADLDDSICHDMQLNDSGPNSNARTSGWTWPRANGRFLYLRPSLRSLILEL